MAIHFPRYNFKILILPNFVLSGNTIYVKKFKNYYFGKDSVINCEKELQFKAKKHFLQLLTVLSQPRNFLYLCVKVSYIIRLREGIYKTTERPTISIMIAEKRKRQIYFLIRWWQYPTRRSASLLYEKRFHYSQAGRFHQRLHY